MLPGWREGKSLRSDRRSTVTAPKIATVERREAGVPVTRHAAPPKGAKCYQRRSGAPLPHVCEGRKSEGGPHADQTTGQAKRWLIRAAASECATLKNFRRLR